EDGGYFAEFDRTRETVNQAEAEKQERRRHRAEQEIFQRGLGRLGPGLVITGEHIERETRELNGQEGEQQLLRRRHLQKPDRREQDQRDILRGLARERRRCDHTER